MTARQLIDSLQNLGEENLDREIVVFDSSSYYTPYKVEIIEHWSSSLNGRILID